MATKKKRREINYYKVLGVSPRAGQEKIKKAYRRRARQTHPDLKGGDHQKFKVVQKAYETLSDPQSRNLYDLRNGFRPNPTKRRRRRRPRKREKPEKDSAWPDVQNVFEKFAQFLEKEWWDEEDYERRGRG